MREYKRILGDTLADPHPPTDRLVLLMTLGNKLGEKSDIEQVTQYLALRDRKNFDLSTSLVHAYDNTHKYAEAEAEYLSLIGNRDLSQGMRQRVDMMLGLITEQTRAPSASGEVSTPPAATAPPQGEIKEQVSPKAATPKGGAGKGPQK